MRNDIFESEDEMVAVLKKISNSGVGAIGEPETVVFTIGVTKAIERAERWNFIKKSEIEKARLSVESEHPEGVSWRAAANRYMRLLEEENKRLKEQENAE